MLPHFFYPVSIGCLATLIIAIFIIKTQRWHGPWTNDSYHGVQKNHTLPTSRVGGLAILGGYFIATLFLDLNLRALFLPLLLTGLIPFSFGFIEDLTKSVSVRSRFIATMVGVFLAVFWTGIHLKHIDIPIVDDYMSWWLVGLLITVIGISGITNAINILDGFNGLASGVVVVIAFIFSFLAYLVQDVELYGLCILIAFTVLGFMLTNYPFGRIFMGDCGAYLTGYLVGWVAILLPVRNKDISPWVSLSVCIYPVTEVLYSMLRRVCAQSKAGQADNLHLHNLIRVKFVGRHFSFLSLRFQNAIVAPTLWLSSSVMGLLAIYFSHSVQALYILCIFYVFWYHLTYRYLNRKDI